MNFEMSEEEMKVLLYVTGAGLVTPVVGVTVVNTTLDTRPWALGGAVWH